VQLVVERVVVLALLAVEAAHFGQAVDFAWNRSLVGHPGGKVRLMVEAWDLRKNLAWRCQDQARSMLDRDR